MKNSAPWWARCLVVLRFTCTPQLYYFFWSKNDCSPTLLGLFHSTNALGHLGNLVAVVAEACTNTHAGSVVQEGVHLVVFRHCLRSEDSHDVRVDVLDFIEPLLNVTNLVFGRDYQPPIDNVELTVFAKGVKG